MFVYKLSGYGFDKDIDLDTIGIFIILKYI